MTTTDPQWSYRLMDPPDEKEKRFCVAFFDPMAQPHLDIPVSALVRLFAEERERIAIVLGEADHPEAAALVRGMGGGAAKEST